MIMDERDLRIIKNELEYLEREWATQIDDDSIRRGSTVLRMLLVQDNLQRAWNHFFREKCIILAPDLCKALQMIPPEEISFAQAGGGKTGAGEIQFAITTKTVMTLDLIDCLHKLGPALQLTEFTLSQFKESPCIVVEGELITRKEVIEYVANTLGAAHLDAGHNKKSEQKLLEFGKIREVFKFFDRDVALYELLSIAQHLIRAPCIKRLMAELNRIT